MGVSRASTLALPARLFPLLLSLSLSLVSKSAHVTSKGPISMYVECIPSTHEHYLEVYEEEEEEKKNALVKLDPREERSQRQDGNHLFFRMSGTHFFGAFYLGDDCLIS